MLMQLKIQFQHMPWWYTLWVVQLSILFRRCEVFPLKGWSCAAGDQGCECMISSLASFCRSSCRCMPHAGVLRLLEQAKGCGAQEDVTHAGCRQLLPAAGGGPADVWPTQASFGHLCAGKELWLTRRCDMQDAVNYSPQQKEALLAAQDQLFLRMHQVLEKREAIVNTLQTNFPCAETEHKNAPLYIQVRGLSFSSYTIQAQQPPHSILGPPDH